MKTEIIKSDTNSELLDAAQMLREYLEGPKCVLPGFDVPDEIWIPFTRAIDGQRNKAQIVEPPPPPNVWRE